MLAHTYTYMYKCKHTFVHMTAHIHTHMYTCMHPYAHINKHTKHTLVIQFPAWVPSC